MADFNALNWNMLLGTCCLEHAPLEHGRIAREPGRSQSKKLMQGIKGIYFVCVKSLPVRRSAGGEFAQSGQESGSSEGIIEGIEGDGGSELGRFGMEADL